MFVMMLSAAFAALVAAGGIAAGVAAPSHSTSSNMARSRSRGFSMIANLTDPSKDLDPPINHLAVNIHTYAENKSLLVLEDAVPARVFYLNGTKEEYQARTTSLLTDAGPFGNLTSIVHVDNTTEYLQQVDGTQTQDHAVWVTYASGQPLVGSRVDFESPLFDTDSPVLMNNYGSDGQFVACKRVGYDSQPLITVQYAYRTCWMGKTLGQNEPQVPDNSTDFQSSKPGSAEDSNDDDEREERKRKEAEEARSTLRWIEKNWNSFNEEQKKKFKEAWKARGSTSTPARGDKSGPNLVEGLFCVDHIPDGCVGVTLVPQCSPLVDGPKGSLPAHEYANEVSCFENVATIEWASHSMAEEEENK